MNLTGDWLGSVFGWVGPSVLGWVGTSVRVDAAGVVA